ncbi:hypothetical protein DPMN_061156 [Dreissena polymorpha]|uniref:Uncharacterized protein n=1 Tax=Dreissena polymorpha TaxID=45954 RepID=A0A9D4HI73_DREPO|nr:hypothetical protein DPMN_061156 [Dreissena polymorpha]
MVQSLDRVLFARLLNVDGNGYNDDVRAVHHSLRLVLVDLHPVCYYSFIEAVGEVMDVTVGIYFL